MTTINTNKYFYLINLMKFWTSRKFNLIWRNIFELSGMSYQSHTLNKDVFLRGLSVRNGLMGTTITGWPLFFFSSREHENHWEALKQKNKGRSYHSVTLPSKTFPWNNAVGDTCPWATHRKHVICISGWIYFRFRKLPALARRINRHFGIIIQKSNIIWHQLFLTIFMLGESYAFRFPELCQWIKK